MCSISLPCKVDHIYLITGAVTNAKSHCCYLDTYLQSTSTMQLPGQENRVQGMLNGSAPPKDPPDESHARLKREKEKHDHYALILDLLHCYILYHHGLYTNLKTIEAETLVEKVNKVPPSTTPAAEHDFPFQEQNIHRAETGYERQISAFGGN
ncbi:unnamed protein product [Sphenostylis stenocarpa]|uniref:Uncharacterized protein n=1 Tax=Sphenostylis stenocarpa TaxID=92480 RepID=A0AA86VW55_9FABA|nr:unnamed protein product [Sphenostylis stenocarpa]